MNRYTAVMIGDIQPSEPTLLRQWVEKTLAESKQPGSPRIAAITQSEPGRWLIEFAAVQPKAQVESRLAANAPPDPLRLERLGWGWPVSAAVAYELINDETGDLLHDPLAGDKPQEEAEHAYPYSRAQAAACALTLLGAIAALLLAFSFLFGPGLNAWMQRNFFALALAVIIYWVALRGLGGLVAPWNYIREVVASQDGLAIRKLFPNKTDFIPWSEISELRLFDSRLSLLTTTRLVSFPASDRFLPGQTGGAPTRLRLLKTILVRSELLFVSGRLGELTYRRFEAR